MPIPPIVATLITAALTLATGPGASAPMAVEDGLGSTRAPAAVRPADGAPPAPAPPALMARRIDLKMEDTAFSPKSIDVKVGETVTFVFTNVGKAVHDAFIGDKAAQEQHEKEMREMKEGHDHAHAGGVTVHPGETGALRYFFDKPGDLEIGCHQPGHYKYGMKVVINVNPV